MKVTKVYDGYWEIKNNEKKTIAHIENFGYRMDKKALKIGDKFICEVRGHQDAMERLEVFLKKNRIEIDYQQSNVDLLMNGIKDVKSDLCKNVLRKELVVMEKKIEDLEYYHTFEYLNED